MAKKYLCGLLVLAMSVSAKTNYQIGNIYVNSIPKCGTHLLTKCIELLTGRTLVEPPTRVLAETVAAGKLPSILRDEFLATHLGYSDQAISVLKKNHFKTFLIYRDPRDKLVSQVYFILNGGWQQSMKNSPLRKLPFGQLLTRLIKGVAKEYNDFLPWLKNDLCCAVKFENLIGSQGGGSRKAQVKELHKIAKHINLPLNNKLVERVNKNLFGGTVTFRQGKTGGWKSHFTKKHKVLFKKVAGDLLIKLGYEKGMNW